MRRGGLLLALPLGGLLLLPGCKAAPEIAGAVTATLTGGATVNPAVGFAVGVATAAVTNAGLRYYNQVRQRAEQDEIAQLAGNSAAGAVVPWRIRHTIPIGNEHGELQVVRDIPNPLAACREVAFSVVDDGKPQWFLSSVCRQGTRWKWASAEPAVERWGFLQ